MNKSKIFNLAGILVCLLLQIGCSSLHRGTVNLLTVRADKNGNKPRDITHEFMKAARAGDYQEARRHWTSEGIAKYESSSYWGGFKGYCDYFNRFPNYKLSVSTPSKKGYRWLELIWYDENHKKTNEGWMFSFRKEEDQWLLVQ